MLYNGTTLEFEGACKEPAKCTYGEFRDYIDSIWYKDGPKIEDDVSSEVWREICAPKDP